MKTSIRRWGFVSCFGLFLAATALADGCGGDDSNGGTSIDDSGAPFDATTTDAPTSNDGSVLADASVDSGSDARPRPVAHVAFVTAATFTGDLVGEAIALVPDAGIQADAGDGGTDYIAASDALCQSAASAAGLSGTFDAIVAINGDISSVTSRIHDSDGPWGLVDGTPVADNAEDLLGGFLRSSIDETENGTRLPHSNSFVWAVAQHSSGVTESCDEWTSSVAGGTGGGGTYVVTSLGAISGSIADCSSRARLYCIEVGAGGKPNVFPTLPSGAKIAFVADGQYQSSFADSDSGVLDASAPDAGDSVHSTGDEICNESARGSGLPGTFHAWLSSSTIGASAYFTSLSMNGPWYRADGEEIAGSLTELTTTGTRTQLELTSDGGFPGDLASEVWTGTSLAGVLGTNCSDYSTLSAGDSTFSSAAQKATDWTSVGSIRCGNYAAGLFCFQQ